MNTFKVSATAKWGGDGNTYPTPFEMLLHNRYFQPGTNVTRDYTNQGQIPGVEWQRGIRDFINALGFNPCSDVKYYVSNSSAAKMSELDGFIISLITVLNLDYEYYETTNFTEYGYFSNLCLSNGSALESGNYSFGNLITSSGNFAASGTLNSNSIGIAKSGTNNYIVSGGAESVAYVAYDPDEGFNDSSHLGGQIYSYTISFTTAPSGVMYCTGWSYGVSQGNTSAAIHALEVINANYIELIEDDIVEIDDHDNPYAPVISQPGGGIDGNPNMDLDECEKVEFPDLPTLSAVSAGFITIYNPSLSQLTSLAGFLWSQPFDLDTFKKLFANPMDAIIGLGIIPVNPTLGSSRSVKFGNVDSGVTMPTLGSQFVELDCGSVEIEKYVDCFMDYSPYTEVQIYIPYSGMHSISADDVMGRTLTLKYHIDCLTGGLAAMLYVSGRGILYQWNGNCICNVPLTAINYSTAIQNAVSAAASVASVGVGAATGLAPLTYTGVAGLATQGANAATTSKPSFERSGNMGGSAGLMSIQTPYVVITRPNMSVPNKLNKFIGNTLNVTKKLSALKGFTMVEMIHLDGIPAMEEEKKELDSILKKGVIF